MLVLIVLGLSILTFNYLFKYIQIEYGETDAWLSMELMFHLSVLPLTRQLTSISGNLWGKNLQVSPHNMFPYTI